MTRLLVFIAKLFVRVGSAAC